MNNKWRSVKCNDDREVCKLLDRIGKAARTAKVIYLPNSCSAVVFYKLVLK